MLAAAMRNHRNSVGMTPINSTKQVNKVKPNVNRTSSDGLTSPNQPYNQQQQPPSQQQQPQQRSFILAFSFFILTIIIIFFFFITNFLFYSFLYQPHNIFRLTHLFSLLCIFVEKRRKDSSNLFYFICHILLTTKFCSFYSIIVFSRIFSGTIALLWRNGSSRCPGLGRHAFLPSHSVKISRLVHAISRIILTPRHSSRDFSLFFGSHLWNFYQFLFFGKYISAIMDF